MQPSPVTLPASAASRHMLQLPALTSQLIVPACERPEAEGSQEGSSSNRDAAGAEAGRPGSSESTREGKRGQGRSHSRVVGQVEGPLQLSTTAQAWKDGLGDVDVGKWDLIYRCAPYACPASSSCMIWQR